MRDGRTSAKEKVEQALLTLLRSEPFHLLTVRRIIAEAGVNRSTFYAYFDDKYDLRAKVVAQAVSLLRESVPLRFFQPFSVQDMVASIGLVHRNRGWFLAVWNANMELNMDQIFQAVLTERALAWALARPGGYPPELFALFYSANALATIKWTLAHGDWSEREVTELLDRNIKYGFFQHYLRQEAEPKF